MVTVARETVITCDRVIRKTACGQPAKTYTVGGPKDTWTIDLCDTHAEQVYGIAVREGRLVKRVTRGRRTDASLKRPFLPDRK